MPLYHCVVQWFWSSFGTVWLSIGTKLSCIKRIGYGAYSYPRRVASPYVTSIIILAISRRSLLYQPSLIVLVVYIFFYCYRPILWHIIDEKGLRLDPVKAVTPKGVKQGRTFGILLSNHMWLVESLKIYI